MSESFSTEPLRYEPTLLASPTNNGQEINITLVPPEPVASDTTILDYRLRITAGGDSVQVFNILRCVAVRGVTNVLYL